jgi:hypothetical protein
MIVDFRDGGRITMPEWLDRSVHAGLRITPWLFAASVAFFGIAIATDIRPVRFFAGVLCLALFLPVVLFLYALIGVGAVALLTTVITAPFRWARARGIQKPKLPTGLAFSAPKGLWDRDMDG